MEETYCIKDNNILLVLSRVVIKQIKMEEDNFIVIVLFAE